MSKLLVIGASILQLPIIKKAKELGHYVAVADYNPNAVGIEYADKFFNASTIDEVAICKVAEQFQPEAIITIATDMPMRAIAKATSQQGLVGISYETAIRATDKGEMRQAFKENNVPSPWFYIINDIEEIKGIEISFPCIIKPADNSGSRGVNLIDDIKQLESAFIYSKKESRSGRVIVEEYMSGDEVSVEIVVYNGKSHVLAITDKLTTNAPYFVEMGHSQPSKFSDAICENIKEVAISAVNAIGLTNGPAHAEIIITNDGAKMVEIGARMGGDCITSHLVPLSTGIDMMKATIDIALGVEPNVTPLFSKASAIRYFDAPKGIIQSIDGIEEALKIEGVKEITFTKQTGDIVGYINSSVDRVGYVIIQSDRVYQIAEIYDNVKKIVNIYVYDKR